MTKRATELEDIYLQKYLHEIRVQAEGVRLSVRALNEALTGDPTQIVTPRVIGAAQSVVNSAGAITRLLWPRPASRDRDGNPLEGQAERQRQWTLARGRALRKLLGGINEAKSPLGARKIRNSFEHFDEYLDGFLFDMEEGRRPRLLVDMAVAPRNAIDYAGTTPTYLRLLDVDADELWVLDETISLRPLIREVERIDAMASEWITKYENTRPRKRSAPPRPSQSPIPSPAMSCSMPGVAPTLWSVPQLPPRPPFPDRTGVN